MTLDAACTTWLQRSLLRQGDVCRSAPVGGCGRDQRGAAPFCQAVLDRDVLARTFRSDQPQPDTGARAWIGEAFSHGPHMISLGMAALMAEFEPGPQAASVGLTLAQHILATHVNLGSKWPQFRGSMTWSSSWTRQATLRR